MARWSTAPIEPARSVASRPLTRSLTTQPRVHKVVRATGRPCLRSTVPRFVRVTRQPCHRTSVSRTSVPHQAPKGSDPMHAILPKRRLVPALLVATVVCLNLFVLQLLPAGRAQTADKSTAAPPADKALVKRGQYVATISGCNHCHTPLKMGAQGPEPDLSRLLSGHPEKLTLPAAPQLPEGPWGFVVAATGTAFAGPWGISYATNLTPDENTGMGAWAEEIFINTLRNGKHWGVARPILPPMPWQFYAQM